jgi:hypothetical protein
MVHFPGLAHTRLCIQRAVTEVYSVGFPHSEIPGSKPACGSPGLIAACHVLHRLLAPRHPPHALSSLIIKLTWTVAPALTQSAGCGFRFKPDRPSRKFAFPQQLRSARAIFALRVAATRVFPCGNTGQSQHALPAYSIVKERCPWLYQGSPLPVGRTAKNAATK